MRKSFTLIETIVVVAVIGLTLPVLFAIIFTLMRQQIKVYRLSQVKREGDYVINIMENTIRSKAVTIHSDIPTDINTVCDGVNPSPGSTSGLYFRDKNKQWFGYSYNNVAKTIISENPSTNLTSSKILVSNFSISCSKNSVYSPASILFGFDICYDTGAGVCTSTRPEESTSILHYQTRIKLRSY